jgi:hypothetical protein
MAYKGGIKGPRPAYQTLEAPRVVSQGTVSHPKPLPKPRPKAPRSDRLRKRQATVADI